MYVTLIFLGGNVVRRYCTLFMENTDRQDIGVNPACRSYNKPESPHRKRVLRVSKTVRRQIGQNSACRSRKRYHGGIAFRIESVHARDYRVNGKSRLVNCVDVKSMHPLRGC